MGWSAVRDCGIVLLCHTHSAFVWMDTALDRNNTRMYVDVTKLSVSQSNMLSFTSGTCFWWYICLFVGKGKCHPVDSVGRLVLVMNAFKELGFSADMSNSSEEFIEVYK